MMHIYNPRRMQLMTLINYWSTSRSPPEALRTDKSTDVTHIYISLNKQSLENEMIDQPQRLVN